MLARVLFAAAVSAALALTPTTVMAAPANDMFANASTITSWSGQASGTAVGATVEVGEPEHVNWWNDDEPGSEGHSVWFRWTAPATGRAVFTTDAEVVDIYNGSSLRSLVSVGQDYCDPEPGYSPACKTFATVAGTTYRIAVDGFERAFTLDWRRIVAPSNDDFASAEVLTGLSAAASEAEGGDLATAEAGEPNHAFSAYTPLHSIWYRWRAPWTSDVTIYGHVGINWHDTCYDDSVVAVYTGSSLSALRYVASDYVLPADPNCKTPNVSFTAKAGEIYHIALDASGGSTPSSVSLEATPVCDINGTTGNDTIVGTAGNDVLCGLEGDDNLKGQGGDDLFIGGPGIDAANYGTAATAVVANLGTGTATGQGADTLRDIENLIGSSYADKLDGNDGTNVLNGGGGDDGLWGQGGNDSILGADGNDTIGGGLGNDRLNGGAGTDVVHYGRAPAVTVNLGTGSATGEGTDVLSLLESITGSPGADRLTGSNGVNLLHGAGGNDSIVGQDGNDKLYGAAGNDALTGGVGTDGCDGGTGTDTATTCETKLAVP